MHETKDTWPRNGQNVSGAKPLNRSQITRRSGGSPEKKTEPNFDGLSYDVDENKGRRSVLRGKSYDVYENKRLMISNLRC
jgi:hypothetical protein